MTDKHADRANGDSYFTVEELEYIKEYLDFCARRSEKGTCDKIGKLRDILQKEKAYIEATKCKTIDC